MKLPSKGHAHDKLCHVYAVQVANRSSGTPLLSGLLDPFFHHPPGPSFLQPPPHPNLWWIHTPTHPILLCTPSSTSTPYLSPLSPPHPQPARCPKQHANKAGWLVTSFQIVHATGFMDTFCLITSTPMKPCHNTVLTLQAQLYFCLTAMPCVLQGRAMGGRGPCLIRIQGTCQGWRRLYRGEPCTLLAGFCTCFLLALSSLQSSWPS